MRGSRLKRSTGAERDSVAAFSRSLSLCLSLISYPLDLPDLDLLLGLLGHGEQGRGRCAGGRRKGRDEADARPEEKESGACASLRCGTPLLRGLAEQGSRRPVDACGLGEGV